MTRFYHTNTDHLASALSGFEFEVLASSTVVPANGGLSHSQVYFSQTTGTDTTGLLFAWTNEALHSTVWPTTGYGYSVDVTSGASDTSFSIRLLRVDSTGATRGSANYLAQTTSGTGIKTSTGLNISALSNPTGATASDSMALAVTNVTNSNMMSNTLLAIAFDDSDTWFENTNFVPGTPVVGLSAEPASTTSIIAKWPAVTGATDYSLERSLDGSTGWTRINGAAPQTGTSFTDTGRSMNTPYYYRVRCTESGVTGPYTATTVSSIRPYPFTEDWSSGWRDTHWTVQDEDGPAVISGGVLQWASTNFTPQYQTFQPHLPPTSGGQTVTCKVRYTGTVSTPTALTLWLSANEVYADRVSDPMQDTGVFLNLGMDDGYVGMGIGNSAAGIFYDGRYLDTTNNPPGFTAWTSGTWYWVKLELVRSTNTLRFKIWADGSAEPSLWTHSDIQAGYNVSAGSPRFELDTARNAETIEIDALTFEAEGWAAGTVSLTGSGTLSGERVWPAVGTSTASTATAYSNQRKIDRTSNGVLWALFWDGTSTTSTSMQTRYSTDNGATWVDPGSSSHFGFSGTGTSNIPGGSFFIDQDDYAHVVYRDRNLANALHYRRGTPNAGRTAWTWSAAQSVAGNSGDDYPDVVAHRDGTGWAVHVVYGNGGSTNDFVYYHKIGVSATGTITMGAGVTISTSYSAGINKYPSIDFNHTGDGKTVAGGTPHLYVAWSAGATGAGQGIRFKKATYSGGTWTWGTEREIDSTRTWGADSQGQTMFDGTRVVINGSNAFPEGRDIVFYERDAADTTTTTRLLLDNPTTSTNLYYHSSSYDAAGNLYIIGMNSNEGAGATQDLVWRKWTRATDTLSSENMVDLTTDDAWVSAKRGYSGNRIDFVYTDGTSPSLTVRYSSIALGASGSADLSGAGTLGLSGRPSVPGSGVFSGSGTLTVPTLAPKPIQTVQLSGAGTLTFPTAIVGVARSGVLSGSGTLTVPTLVPAPAQTVQLSGAGTLSLISQQQEVGSVALAGAGTLALTRGPITVVGAAGALSGSGSLTFVGKPGTAGSTALSGSGTLAFAAVAGFARSGALSGSGTLTVPTRVPGPIQTLGLSGSGTLALTAPVPRLVAVGDLSGAGTLTLTRGAVTLSGPGALSGSGTLVPTFAVSFALTGALSGAGTLTLTGAGPGLVAAVALSGSGELTLAKWFLFQANAYGGTATGTGWVNPSNATGVDNSTYATWTTATPDAVSEPLVVSNFGTWSSIPAGSTIPKITVRVKGYVGHE